MANTDAFAFDGGHGQDYAVSAGNCAVVSDGSSGKGMKTPPRTDIGSLTIANAAAEELGEVGDRPFSEIITAVETRVKRAIAFVMKALTTLKLTDFSATLLMAFIRHDDALLHIQGDGITAVRRRMRGKEFIIIRKYTWKADGRSAPPYLVFKLRGTISAYMESSPVLTVETVWYEVETKNVKTITVKQPSAEDAVNGVTMTITGTAFDDLIALGVFTDGLNEIGNVEWWKPVIKIMLAPEGNNLKGLFQRLYQPGPGTLGDDVAGARVIR